MLRWDELQAHAWVALGKFCLVDEATAKKNVPLFVQELARATNPAVRFPVSQCSSCHATHERLLLGTCSQLRA